ncbi:hypothetical protein BCSJ1_26208, partial [Bacillus cereus SJ1]
DCGAAVSVALARPAARPRAGVVDGAAGPCGHQPAHPGAAPGDGAGDAGGQPHLVARHPRDACSAALPFCLQIRRAGLAADRHPGHGCGHAVYRTHLPPRCAAHGPVHAGGAGALRSAGGVP